MADPTTPSTGASSEPTGAADAARSGFPDDPAAPPSGALDAPTPTASAEPEAQVAAASATDFTAAATNGGVASDTSLLPPPAAYEMPDEYAQSWLDRTRDWVEKNPALAVVAAAGVGLVVGRLVMGLLPEPEPPTFVERVERRTRRMRKEAKRGLRGARKGATHAAGDAGDALQHQLARAAEALSDAAGTAAERAGSGVEKATDVAEAIGDAVKAAVVGAVNRGADSWVGKLRK